MEFWNGSEISFLTLHHVPNDLLTPVDANTWILSSFFDFEIQLDFALGMNLAAPLEPAQSLTHVEVNADPAKFYQTIQAWAAGILH